MSKEQANWIKEAQKRFNKERSDGLFIDSEIVDVADHIFDLLAEALESEEKEKSLRLKTEVAKNWLLGGNEDSVFGDKPASRRVIAHTLSLLEQENLYSESAPAPSEEKIKVGDEVWYKVRAKVLELDPPSVFNVRIQYVKKVFTIWTNLDDITLIRKKESQ
jgi:hypothetical protein